MIKKTITFTDFNGEDQSEEYYFNFTKGELIEMEMSANDGYGTAIQKIVESKNNQEIVNIFKKLIRQAYGVRSLDGKRFIKNDNVFEEFESTEAYSELFIELATDSKAASEFMTALMPPKLIEEVAEIVKKNLEKSQAELNPPQDRLPKQDKSKSSTVEIVK